MEFKQAIVRAKKYLEEKGAMQYACIHICRPNNLKHSVVVSKQGQISGGPCSDDDLFAEDWQINDGKKVILE